MGLTRRRFLQLAAGTAAATGASRVWSPEIVKALADPKVQNTPVVWIQAQSCSGCSVSLLNANYPSVADTILDAINLMYHPNVSATSGEQAIKTLERAEKELPGKFLLVWEGDIPTKDGGLYCTIGEENGKLITAAEWAKRLGSTAMAVVAVGACATYGGIPAAPPNPTGAMGVGDFFKQEGIKTPVVNIPGCPAHPEDMVGTIAYLLLFGLDKLAASLDKLGRPGFFFGPEKLIHDNCERRKYFDEGQFATFFGDLKTGHMCLYELGCRGPVTISPCPTRQWNSRVNWCIGAGAPCIGCFAPEFPGPTQAAFYEKLPDIKLPGIRVSPDKFGKYLGIATAAAVVAHGVGRLVTSGKGKEG